MIIQTKLPSGVWATVGQEGSEFVLSWGDYVANEWQERFTALSHALVRLAMLAKCCESDSDRFFAVSEADMPAVSEKLFAETLS
jgi:hypothetical protein